MSGDREEKRGRGRDRDRDRDCRDRGRRSVERSRSPIGNRRDRDRDRDYRDWSSRDEYRSRSAHGNKRIRRSPGVPLLGNSRSLRDLSVSTPPHIEDYRSDIVTIREGQGMRHARKSQGKIPIATGPAINKNFEERDRHVDFFEKLTHEIHKGGFVSIGRRLSIQKNISFFELDIHTDSKEDEDEGERVIRVSVSGQKEDSPGRGITRGTLEKMIDKVVGAINKESRYGSAEYQYIKGHKRSTAQRFVNEINRELRYRSGRSGIPNSRASCAELTQAIENQKKLKSREYTHVDNKGNANYMLDSFKVRNDGSYHLRLHEATPCKEGCARRHEEVNGFLEGSRYSFFSKKCPPSPSRISTGSACSYEEQKATEEGVTNSSVTVTA